MDREVHDKLVYAHGGFMIFVWMFAVPFAVGANMYARKNNKTWGVQVHMWVMALAVLSPLLSSTFMAVYVAGGVKFRPHSLLGFCISMVSYCQIAFGIANHCLYRYRKHKNILPESRPWNNLVHIWLGRVLLLLAIINIPLGMRIKRPPVTAYILYAIWLTVLAGAFTWLIWMKPKEKEDDDDDDDTSIVRKPEEIEQVGEEKK